MRLNWFKNMNGAGSRSICTAVCPLTSQQHPAAPRHERGLAHGVLVLGVLVLWRGPCLDIIGAVGVRRAGAVRGRADMQRSRPKRGWAAGVATRSLARRHAARVGPHSTDSVRARASIRVWITVLGWRAEIA